MPGHVVRDPILAVLCAALLASCRAAPPVQPEPADPCIVAAGSVARQLRVAVPAPRSLDSLPSIVRAQLEGTLLRVDCTGALLPSLATRWSDSAGLVWRFELRPDAAFSDGTPLDAHAVLAAWSAGVPAATLFASLAADGNHALHVELHEPARPHLFADPALAITPSQPAPDRGPGGGWHLAAREPITLAAASGRTATFVPYDDLRAALNDEVHALVTSDPDIIAYARSRTGYDMAPLPWTRTYVFATGSTRQEPRLPDEVAAALARDVARGHVATARPPFWWETAACGVPGVRFANRQARDVVYPREDRVAQALAERIAALAWPPASAPAWVRDLLPHEYGAAGALRVRPLDERALLTAIRARLPLAVIVPVPHMHDLLCSRAGRPAAPRALLEAGWQITPVLDARDVLIHRDGAGRVRSDAFGAVRFEAP